MKKMNNQEAHVNYFEVEKEWTERKDMYDSEPLSQAKTDLLINRILTNSILSY